MSQFSFLHKSELHCSNVSADPPHSLWPSWSRAARRCGPLNISVQNAYIELHDNPTQVQSLVITDGRMDVVLFQFGRNI